MTRHGDSLETGHGAYRCKQRKRRLKHNNPALQPGKLRTLMSMNFWIRIDPCFLSFAYLFSRKPESA